MRKGWGESHWPDPQSHQPRILWWMLVPRGMGTNLCISVLVWTQVRKTTTIWEWRKVFLIGTQRDTCWSELNQSSASVISSQGHQENFGSQECSLPTPADKKSMSRWLCFLQVSIQVWRLQLASVWSRYGLPRRPQLLPKPVAHLPSDVSHEAQPRFQGCWSRTAKSGAPALSAQSDRTLELRGQLHGSARALSRPQQLPPGALRLPL